MEPQMQPEPQPIQQPVQQSISQPVQQSISQPVQQSISQPVQQSISQSVDSIPEAVAVRESQIPSGSIPDAVLALNQENEGNEGRQLSPNEKEDIRALSIKFEKIINNIHDKFMAIGRVDSRDYKRLSSILENLSVSYGRYLTPNSEFMINSMKRKLDELSPLPNLQKQGEKFITYLKAALQNFYTKSITFSKFEKNSFELNEQFNTVLSQLIDKLKHGKHEETIILIRLLRGYIDEIMKNHSITKKEITKNVFIERLNNMISKPIEIVRKVVRPAPKITEATYTSRSSESRTQPQQRPQTRMTTKTKDVNLPSLLDAGTSKRAVEIATKEKKEVEDKLIQSQQKTRELELRISRMEERAKSKQRSSSSSKSSKPVPAVLPTYQAPLATQNQRQEPVRNLGQESVPVRRPESEQVPVRNPGQVPETEPRPVPMRRSRQNPLSSYRGDPLTKDELWKFIYYASQIKNKN
jgi:hypothetical protein